MPVVRIDQGIRASNRGDSRPVLHSGVHILAHNRYPFTTAANFVPLLSELSTKLSLHTDVIKDTWMITSANTGTQTALFIWLEGIRVTDAQRYVEFSDNYFCLFQNDEKQIIATRVDVAPIDRSVDVAGRKTRWKHKPLHRCFKR